MPPRSTEEKARFCGLSETGRCRAGHSPATHVIVGFTPGTAADITARVVANGAGAALGQQIVIENKPGAGSSVAAE